MSIEVKNSQQLYTLLSTRKEFYMIRTVEKSKHRKYTNAMPILYIKTKE